MKRFSNKNRVSTPGPGTYSDHNYREEKSLEKECYNDKTIIFKYNRDRNNVYQVDKNEVFSLNYNKNIMKEKEKKNKKIIGKKETKKRLEEEQKE